MLLPEAGFSHDLSGTGGDCKGKMRQSSMQDYPVLRLLNHPGLLFFCMVKKEENFSMWIPPLHSCNNITRLFVHHGARLRGVLYRASYVT
jgi:hypothetical protein